MTISANRKRSAHVGDPADKPESLRDELERVWEELESRTAPKARDASRQLRCAWAELAKALEAQLSPQYVAQVRDSLWSSSDRELALHLLGANVFRLVAEIGWLEGKAKAASRKRGDALTHLIRQRVEQAPEISETELLAYLEDCAQTRHVVEEVNDDTIEWKDDRGRFRTTPRTALKDRLARARRAHRSR